ncbi:diguanylate cyclase domain-containing protein [Ruminococcus flavefaciens]|uniref:Diguanylate cyclase, GGDEF domain n=1 Tax=Ruminococcus flavefaciens TaxID=1265 RepID=A0A1M7MRL2_RUMFL|nr:diguanylate cyclase [Ruminococcus flavefaciens]SHM93706.1 Diguanylate cyclase, GGDEF domain [Ruminococcus flavefaciens]
MRGQKKMSAVSLVLIVQLIIMLVLSLVITMTISSETRKNTIQNLETITDERANIIETYVKNAEDKLTYFSKSQEVKKLLESPENLSLQKSGQAYTEDFSRDIDNLEGLWIGEWTSHCIAHTNPETVGITTRKNETALRQLQDSLIAAGDGVYNAGMIISPASGKQIVSMYKTVYGENGDPIGFVGLGIYTEGLVNTLNNLSIKGAKDVTYAMVNVKDDKYVFNNNSELIGTETTNSEIKSICKDIRKGNNTKSEFEYTENGKKYIAIFSYIKDYNWIFILNDTKSEVYSLTNVMRVYMAIFGFAIIVLMLIFNFISKKQEKANQKLASTIIKSNKTKESLYTAMFKDVLTDVRNRIAFSMDFEEQKSNPSEPYYFVMYNINGFSSVNTRYGNDVGDWLLVRTVDILGQVFKNGKIYRTGSDEFIVALKGNIENVAYTDVIEDATEAYKRLTAGQNTPMGRINFEFRSSVCKKSGAINTSIITVLKDMINKNSNATVGQITYNDLDS